MKLLIAVALFASFLQPITSFAEIKTITHTVQQPVGGSQAPDDARTAGIARAKREALEQFAPNIESMTVVKESRVDIEEILALTAGVTKTEVIKEKNYTDGDGFGLEITVKVELDTTVLEKSLKRLLQDRSHLKDLKSAREREKKLLSRIVDLEKENQQKGRTKQQSAKLKKEFQTASQGLTAVEWFDKAYALWDGKKSTEPKKVIEYLTHVIRLDPNLAEVFVNRGNAYFNLKQFDLAVADYNQSIRLEPNFAMAYYNRGVANANLKQFDQTVKDFSRAIRIDQNYATAYNNRGSAYANLNQPNRAITDYDQAIRLDPNDAVAYVNRGFTYGELDQLDRAIADYDMSIRLDANYAAAYVAAGNIGIEDVIYHVIRCSLVHCDDKSAKITWNNAISLGIDPSENPILNHQLIWGLIGAVVLSPANSDESITEQYWLLIADFKMFISELWGRIDIAKRVVKHYTGVSIP